MKRGRAKTLKRCVVWCGVFMIYGSGMIRNVNAAELKELQGISQGVEENNFDGEIFMPGVDGIGNEGGISPGSDGTENAVGVIPGSGGTEGEGGTSPGTENTGDGISTLPGNGSTENGTDQSALGNLFSDGTGNENSYMEPGDTSQPDAPTDSECGRISYSGSSSSDGSAGGASSGKIYRQPKFSLESSGLSGKQITAGEETELAVVFRNRSQNEAAYNLKVTVKAAEEKLCLSASSFYFTKVSPGKPITLSTIVQADFAADPGRTTMTYTFEYENVKGEAYTSSEEILLNIYQPVQAVVEGFSLADRVYSQETVTADLQIRNTGRAAVYNVQAALTGQGLFVVKTIYAGTMEPGTSYDGFLKIYIGDKNMTAPGVSGVYDEETAYGETTGTLTLTYEDAAGTIYTETQEFTTIIQKPEIIELKVEEEKQTNQWWAVSLAAVILLFTAILAGMWRNLKKKQNQMADLLALQEEKRAL